MKYALSLLLISLCGMAFAQNTISNGNTFPLVGYWHIGAKRNVLYTKAITTVKKGETTSETITVNAVWQIKDSTDKNYTINYTYRNFNFSNPKDSINIAFAEIFKGVTVKYRTSELGIFDTILNLNEIISISKKGIHKIIEKLKWPDNAVTENVTEKIKTILMNPVILENSFKEELILIHYFYGLEYKLNEPYSYNSYLENNLGGEAFPAKVVFKLTAISVAKDKAIFNAVHTPEPNEYKRILYQTYSSMAAQMELPLPDKKDFETATMTHNYQSEVSIAQGWPISVKVTKISNVKDTKSTEVTTTTLTK